MTRSTHEAGPNIFPALRYRDARAAVEWLAGTFGFEERLVVPGPDGAVVHAEMGFGPGVIMLGSAGDAGATKGGIYVYVEDVDAHHERARAAGAEIVRELAETDYGSREYSARDPEGHSWSFGTYLPGPPKT